MVYAGIISKVIPIEEYGKDKTYDIKRPNMKTKQWKQHGDNIYYRYGNKWKQRLNPHHSKLNIQHDIDGLNVLICEDFWYYGVNAIEIPSQLHEVIKKGPSHKRIKNINLVQEFYNWLICNKKGLCGMPEMEPQQNLKSCVNIVFDCDS